jgi:hypothetical protein
MTSIFFWAFLYKYEEKNSYLNTFVHLLNSVR